MQVIKGGETQYTIQTDETHIIGKRLTLYDVKAIRQGHGGYVSIIPKCTVDDKTYHILSDTFWQQNRNHGIVVGDLGGGVKVNERPYDVLYNGIKKKMPTWLYHLTLQIESGATEIYSIEYAHIKRNDVRYSIIIMVDITPFIAILDQLLHFMKDVREIKAYEEVERSILSLPNLSYGLTYYRDYLVYYQKSV